MFLKPRRRKYRPNLYNPIALDLFYDSIYASLYGLMGVGNYFAQSMPRKCV